MTQPNSDTQVCQHTGFVSTTQLLFLLIWPSRPSRIDYKGVNNSLWAAAEFSMELFFKCFLSGLLAALCVLVSHCSVKTSEDPSPSCTVSRTSKMESTQWRSCCCTSRRIWRKPKEVDMSKFLSGSPSAALQDKVGGVAKWYIGHYLCPVYLYEFIVSMKLFLFFFYDNYNNNANTNNDNNGALLVWNVLPVMCAWVKR